MGGIGIVGEDDFYIHFGGIISFDVSGNTLVTAF